MKIAILSDIHDNQTRLGEALTICAKEKIETCICCGDVGILATAQMIFDSFRNVYFALGNADFNLRGKTGLFSENVIYNEDFLEIKIDGLKIAAVHHDYKARSLAEAKRYDVVFYGHTHTPWKKKIKKTTILNPGEISGQFGRASFAIFDTKTQKAILKIID